MANSSPVVEYSWDSNTEHMVKRKIQLIDYLFIY